MFFILLVGTLEKKSAKYLRRRIRNLFQQCYSDYFFIHALQRNNTENSKQIFPEKELRCHRTNFHIHGSVRDLYIPTIDLPILVQENMRTDPWEYIDHSHTHT